MSNSTHFQQKVREATQEDLVGYNCKRKQYIFCGNDDRKRKIGCNLLKDDILKKEIYLRETKCAHKGGAGSIVSRKHQRK